jgi:hypothetical protein
MNSDNSWLSVYKASNNAVFKVTVANDLSTIKFEVGPEFRRGMTSPRMNEDGRTVGLMTQQEMHNDLQKFIDDNLDKVDL